jgi:(p)ppGpp synthase/HD superfamily hydrolase
MDAPNEPMLAREFAVEAHGEQMYGEHPYSIHLFEVVQISLQICNRDGVLHRSFVADVAWLHDVVEDTDATVDELAEEFGRDRASAVALLTDPEGGSRKEKKAELHRRLSTLDVSRVDHRAALLVKAADRLANARASNAEGKDRLVKMYRVEHPEFRAAVYRAGLCDELWAELDELLA